MMGTQGLGRSKVRGRSRVPSPPHMMHTFISGTVTLPALNSRGIVRSHRYKEIGSELVVEWSGSPACDAESAARTLDPIFTSNGNSMKALITATVRFPESSFMPESSRGGKGRYTKNLHRSTCIPALSSSAMKQARLCALSTPPAQGSAVNTDVLSWTSWMHRENAREESVEKGA